MKKVVGLSFALLLVLALGTQAIAQSTYDNNNTANPSSQSMTVSGKITAVSGNTITVQSDNGDQMTFTLAPSSALPVDAKEGSHVTVNYSTLSGGQYQASTVTLDNGNNTTPSSSTYGNTGATGTTGTSNYNNTSPSTTTTTSDMDKDMDTGMARHRAGRLPATASPMPIFGLVAGLSLAAAAGLRLIGRSM